MRRSRYGGPEAPVETREGVRWCEGLWSFLPVPSFFWKTTPASASFLFPCFLFALFCFCRWIPFIFKALFLHSFTYLAAVKEPKALRYWKGKKWFYTPVVPALLEVKTRELASHPSALALHPPPCLRDHPLPSPFTGLFLRVQSAQAGPFLPVLQLLLYKGRSFLVLSDSTLSSWSPVDYFQSSISVFVL